MAFEGETKLKTNFFYNKEMEVFVYANDETAQRQRLVTNYWIKLIYEQEKRIPK